MDNISIHKTSSSGNIEKTTVENLSDNKIQFQEELGINSAKDVTISFATDPNSFVSKNAGLTYETCSAIIFRGTDTLGSPSAIKVIKKASSGNPTHSIRVIDTTNGNAVIAEVTGLTSTTQDIADLGDLSNLSESEAVWEIQFKRDASGAVNIDVICAQIQF